MTNLRMLPEPETLVFPAITEDTPPPPPASTGHRVIGPWLDHHEHHERREDPPEPADDMAELAALTRRLIAQRPELAHPARTMPGTGR